MIVYFKEIFLFYIFFKKHMRVARAYSSTSIAS
jgi:hypothetical protein